MSDAVVVTLALGGRGVVAGRDVPAAERLLCERALVAPIQLRIEPKFLPVLPSDILLAAADKAGLQAQAADAARDALLEELFQLCEDGTRL